MKVWVTKYLFTKGIQEVEVETTSVASMVRVPGQYVIYLQGNDWHDTREKAVEYGLAMVRNKLASLKKQEAKLKKLLKELGS